MTKLEAKGFRLSPFPVLLPAAEAAWLNPETNGLLDADTRSEKLHKLCEIFWSLALSTQVFFLFLLMVILSLRQYYNIFYPLIVL